jgi:hypothetical protein
MQIAAFRVMIPRKLVVHMNGSEEIVASSAFIVVRGSRFLRWQRPKQLHDVITQKKSVCNVAPLKS